ncbi:MAG: 1,6-anhydro-N-acetylmuramyl-L-alanine amidase AmpD [bacterium]
MNTSTGLLNSARQQPSPNCDDRPAHYSLDLIVLHNISLPPQQFGGPWIDALFTNQLPTDADPFFAEIAHLRVSSHLLIRRDSEVVQYVPFHRRAFHAGLSAYQGREACNNFSIGIELEGSDYTPFTEAQYTALCAVVDALLHAYPSLSPAHITGHEHIAPTRKTDPGPYFDWQRLADYYQQRLPAPANKISTLMNNDTMS